MADLHDKIVQILQEKFEGLKDGLDVVEETGRVIGAVISEDFRGLDHEERQNRLWKHLEERLSKDELRRVGPIVTMTPLEAEIDVSLDD